MTETLLILILILLAFTIYLTISSKGNSDSSNSSRDFESGAHKIAVNTRHIRANFQHFFSVPYLCMRNTDIPAAVMPIRLVMKSKKAPSGI